MSSVVQWKKKVINEFYFFLFHSFVWVIQQRFFFSSSIKRIMDGVQVFVFALAAAAAVFECVCGGVEGS